MKKQKNNVNRGKRNKFGDAEREEDERILLAGANKYSKVTLSNIDRLKKERIGVIERVLTTHRIAGKLPSILDNAFPPSKRSSWSMIPDRFTKSVATEANWTFARIGSNYLSLNLLLSQRRRFATHLLLNELGLASTVLAECIARFGPSTWSTESELLLAEYQGGFENNRAMLSLILDRPLHLNDMLLAEFSSQRVDATLSPINYMRTIHAFINNGQYGDIHNCLPFYLGFTLMPILAFDTKLDSEDAAFYLYFYSCRPLIDHYNATVKLLRHAMCFGNHEMVRQLAGGKQLNRIAESELNTLLTCGFSQQRPNHTDAVYDAFRMYLSEQFDAVIQLASFHIVRDPLNFSWYELLASASLMGQKPLPNCLPSESKAQTLLKAVFDFYSYGDNFESAANTLQKNSIALDSTPLGFQIAGFCLRNTTRNAGARHWAGIIYDLHVTPTVVPFLPSTVREDGLRHLRSYPCAQTGPIAEEIMRWGQSGDSNVCDPALNTERGLLLRAEVYSSSRRHRAAEEIYGKMLNDSNHMPIRAGEIIRGAFACRLDLGEFGKSATIVSSATLSPLAVVQLVDIRTAARAYSAEATHVDKNEIAWPILMFWNYKLGNTSLEDVFVAYANFIETSGHARPSQIGRDGVLQYGETPFRSFLRWVCHPYLLDSDIEYEGTTDVEGERVAICQLLQLIDPENTIVYAEEISQLRQQLAVRKAMRQVVQGRIHFNLEGIEEALDSSYFERFTRYLAMTKLSDGTRRSVELHWDSNVPAKDMIVEAPVVLFRELFHDLRRAFLFSNEHGLDSYLSVRIRHQTIKGALRSVFERFKKERGHLR